MQNAVTVPMHTPAESYYSPLTPLLLLYYSLITPLAPPYYSPITPLLLPSTPLFLPYYPCRDMSWVYDPGLLGHRPRSIVRSMTQESRVLLLGL